MCGIVGYIGEKDALPILVSGLERLEYRGYDSAGVAVFQDGEVEVKRAKGKLAELKKLLDLSDRKNTASLGIGHTRWATHGKPSEDNAHPHTAGRVSLIHNGIIENYVELHERLVKEGCKFTSETDTEVAAHLLASHLDQGEEPFEALKKVCSEIKGSYAFLAIDSKNPDRILVAKNATPIVIGFGEGEMYVASDIPAILGETRRVAFLEDGDIAEVTISSLKVENNGKPIEREVQTVTWDPVTAQKGGYKHYMLKEINEQVEVVTESFRGRVHLEAGTVELPELTLTNEQVKSINRIILLACGTAWHACLVAKFYLEEFTGIPCEVDYASEFRYRSGLIDEKSLVIAISQSGETADTLAALQTAIGKCATLAICNVVGSSVARKVDNVIFQQAGPEISVASTKAFTTQLVVAYLLAIELGTRRGTLEEDKRKELVEALVHLPTAIEKALKTAPTIKKIARKYHQARDFLYLGRGVCYPVALEGALKLKEISYIHAEGYPAGEMKHGPIALIDEDMPTVVVLQKQDVLFDKTLSNLREVESRGSQIISITDVEEHKELHNVSNEVVEVPFLTHYLSPIILTIPLQLLAYHVADFNGTDVDLPRNLAKSVTVE